jgi:hypothetical protein
MKTEVKTFIALSLFTLGVAALPAAASDAETLRVTVPFDFTAGPATLPAGDYVISQQIDGRFLTIGGRKGGAIIMTMPQGTQGDLKASTLTFERTSKGAMLLEVHMAGRPSVIMNHSK